MADPRRDLPAETVEFGRDVEDETAYLADQHEVLRFSHAQRCLENGLEPSVLFADDHCYRAIAHDLTGDRSEVYKNCHSDVARAGRKALELPRTRHFWNCDRPLSTVLLQTEKIVERIAHLHLYFREEDVLISYKQWGETITLLRPPQLSKAYEASVTFVPMPPPELMHLGVEGAKACIAEAIALLELQRLAAGVTGRAPLETKRPLYDAVDDDVIEKAYEEYETFCDDHFCAYQLLRQGRRNVTFPAGTVFWRLRANVKVAGIAATR